MSTEAYLPPRPRRGVQIVVGFLLFFLGSYAASEVFTWTVHPYAIPSSAMEPTLRCARPDAGCEGDSNDRIMVLQFHPFWTPRRGSIVAFEAPHTAQLKCGTRGTFVKRVIGMPGETVSERDGLVSIDGTPLQEPYVEHRYKGPAESWSIPPDAYFVMGDNRAQSCDSRVFGSLPRANLVGPAVVRYWPLARMGKP